MRGGKSQTGKQVERKCGSCGNTFRSQAFPAHVKKCERLKKAQDGRVMEGRSMKGNCERGCSRKLLVHVILFSHSSIHLTHIPFQSQVVPQQQMRAMTLATGHPPLLQNAALYSRSLKAKPGEQLMSLILTSQTVGENGGVESRPASPSKVDFDMTFYQVRGFSRLLPLLSLSG